MDSTKFSIPIAVVLAGVVIAGAIIYSNRDKLGGEGPNDNEPKTIFATDRDIPGLEQKLKTIRPIDSSDRVKGDLNAPVKMIVYGDLQCPACRYFDGEINKLYDAYSASTSTPAQVAIALRHFPLPFHRLAVPEALNAECVREQGGNEKFFQYVEEIYAATPEQGEIEPARIPAIANSLVSDQAKLKACVDSKKYQSVIDKDSREATAAGAPGTPFVVIITPSGERKAIFGGVPFETLKPEIDNLLSN